MGSGGNVLSKLLLNTVVLAGGKTSDEMRAATGVENRAMVALGGRMMLDFVVQALRSAKSVDRLYVVGEVPANPAYTLVPERSSLVENLVAGVTAAQADSSGEYILISTSDIPFITSAGVDDFVAQAAARGADLCYPIIPMDSYRKRFPQIKRTTLKVREGEFTGGNMMVVRTEFITKQQEIIGQAYAARKDVLRLAKLLGGNLLWRVLLAQTVAPSQLTVPMLEAGVSRLLGGGNVAAIVTEHPEIGTDVDRPEAIDMARKILALV
ncbi:MAG: hypothetical protein JWQ02_1781 [Capsulimonas sp.]|nr:hypothetical protein [Capsulimonas sp.]